jgi:tRNA G18 (ribose-2'-O)-methylase SpoU
MPLSPPLDATPDEVKEALAPLRHDFSVAVFAAENAFAVGAIIRVAHNFLAREIVLVGHEPHYEKASMGMEKYESIVRVADEEALLEHVRGRPLWCLEKEHATRSLYASDPFPRDIVLVFGSERLGIPKALIDRADAVVGIPIYGVNNSLPLAVAAGIVMSEWTRRKYSAALERP